MQPWATETEEHTKTSRRRDMPRSQLSVVSSTCALSATPVTVSPPIQTSSSTWLT